MKTLTHKLIVYIALYLLTAFIVASLFIWAPYENNDFPYLRAFIIFFASVLLTRYLLYMTFSPWYGLKSAARTCERKRHAYQPAVSVIIPAWNEEVGLIPTIKSVLKNKYPRLEIVVVNDGSTDKSDALMRAFLAEHERKQHPVPIIYRYKENGGKGQALNEGIEHANGSLIITIDADCALTPTTIRNFVRHFEDPSVMAAVGNVKIGNTKHLLGTLQYLEFLFSFYCKKADALFNTIYIIGGAAGAFRREVFDKIGMYSTKNITEDIDLSVRIQAAGMKIAYAADAVVYTEGAETFSGLLKQRLRWKQGRFQTFYEHRKLFFSTDEKHNTLLTWVVLPLAVFGDLQLFFEVLFLVFLYVYSFLTHDFSSFIAGIMVVSAMFLVQVADDRSKNTLMLYALAPIGWLLFYITTVVEYHALIRSAWGIMTRQKLTWQRWQRKGCIDSGALATSSYALGKP